jgi:hypothetical protein
MKKVTLLFKESENKETFNAKDWNDFSNILFQKTPISYIEDIEDLEVVFENGFENNFIKIQVINL